mgnify:CR=1 FL=1
MWSLIWSEDSRQKFLDIAQGSVINADVLKQARFGNMLTMALFHDLQDPLFRKYSFDASNFLTGVQPALTNFHDTLGQLQNEFPCAASREERTERLLQRMHQIVASSMHEKVNGSRESNQDEMSLPDNQWTKQVNNDPNSLAAKLNNMVTPKMFGALFLTTETAAMLSNYKEGSTKVLSVALLSARAMTLELDDDGDRVDAEFPKTTMVDSSDGTSIDGVKSIKEEKPTTEDEEQEPQVNKMEVASENYDGMVQDKSQGEEMVKSKGGDSSLQGDSQQQQTPMSDSVDNTPVAAQIEVLYEMNQTVEVKPENFDDTFGDAPGEGSSSERYYIPTTREEATVWVGTFEGWLNGSPDDALRWKITHLRPPSAEFPGLHHPL